MRYGYKVLRPSNELGKTHSAPLQEFLKVRNILRTLCLKPLTQAHEDRALSPDPPAHGCICHLWTRNVTGGGDPAAKFTLSVGSTHPGSGTSSETHATCEVPGESHGSSSVWERRTWGAPRLRC